ncbi:MAG: efflux RND transporter periplasmic adaptor subunit, partial [Moritella sp.]|uniref:efflux RND transporter periplasmic adaptor subunit n=1 Tax=Moritella sp. TaxID=78556 RepID=UPI0029BA5ADC
FPAVLDSVQSAQISFRVAGKLDKIFVKEGDMVEEGQILAQLDPTDFKVTLDYRQATYDRTRADFNRGSELIEDGYISRAQYDKMKADFASAKSQLQQARNELDYTQLKASFSGVIGRRYVQNFEEVQAKQEVFSLNDVTHLEVQINIPEGLVKLATDGQSIYQVFATFEASGDKKFPLTVKEVAKKADVQTQTFAITFLMPQPDELTLLPGMTSNVLVQTVTESDNDVVYLLPINAVKGALDLSPMVFIVDPETNKLKEQPVKVADMFGDRIKVLEGLSLGDRVVIAGIAFMRDGQEVTLLPYVEQADSSTAP